MISISYLTHIYHEIHYWQTLFIGASVNGSVGLLAALFLADLKKHISSRQRYLLFFIASTSLMIIPATSHFMLKKKIDICTLKVVLNNSVSCFEQKHLKNDSLQNKGQAGQSCRPVPPTTMTDLQFFWPMLWLTGVFFVGFRILTGFYAIRKIVTNGIQIDHGCIQATKQALKINQDVKVVVSNDVTMPSTVGFIRPIIVVPKQCLSWSAEQWKTVLFHEMYHIKRCDSFLNTMLQIICALHWYNPLIWMTAAMFREERETSCDQFVMKSGIKPNCYAMHLLEIIRSGAGFKNANHFTVGVDGMPKIEKRIRQILGFSISKNEETKFAACLCFFFVSLILFLSIFKVNFVFKENSQTAQIKYSNDLVSFVDTANGIVIVDAPTKDIPSYWPLGENWEGAVYAYHHNGERQGVVFMDKKIVGFKIYAAADGVVKNVSLLDATKNFATITILHKNNLSTSYTYVTNVIAKPGDIVKKGALIAMGTGFCLAFSVKYKTGAIDPMPFLAKCDLTDF